VTVIIFDICIQDEGGAGLLRFSSVSGDYEFIRCANGFTVSGKGNVSINGCIVNLNGGSANTPPGGHSIQATADRCTHAGNGSVRLPATKTVYAVADHDITNNTCACP
jgi:hypothetical protein